MTKLSEVIHLYIGQECQTTARKESESMKPMGFKRGKMVEVNILSNTVAVDFGNGFFPTDFPFNEIKPILIPFNDKTQLDNVHSIEWFLEMIKRGFDFFKLVESNQAIDKTKI